MQDLAIVPFTRVVMRMIESSLPKMAYVPASDVITCLGPDPGEFNKSWRMLDEHCTDDLLAAMYLLGTDAGIPPCSHLLRCAEVAEHRLTEALQTEPNTAIKNAGAELGCVVAKMKDTYYKQKGMVGEQSLDISIQATAIARSHNA